MRVALLTAGLLCAAPVRAANDDAELWTTAGASGALGGAWLASAETIARFSRDDGGLYEGEIGGFVGRRLGGGVSAWVGYVHVPRVGPNEGRTRQQVTFDPGAFAGGKLSGRVRLEQRFRAGGDTGWRLRPQIRFARPLVGNGPSLVLSHESFVGLNDTGWGQRSGHERMRNFVGLSVPITKGFNAEAGYLNQHDHRPGRDSVDHVGALTVSHMF